jgi:hypothetical protein
MNLHAQIIEEAGTPKFALLPIKEYESQINELSDFDSIEDLADYLSALRTKGETKVWHSLEDVKSELGIR